MLNIDRLNFSYDTENVLSNISLNIDEGGFLVMIGPNGGGKSTLLKLILGLLPSKDGEIKLFGGDIASALSHISYVPQDSSSSKSSPVNVLDVSMMGFYRTTTSFGQQLTKGEIVDRSMAALELFDMANYRRRRLNELSTGQRQRVYLARAIATTPRLMILDEPISGIDPVGQQKVLDVLQSKLSSCSIIFVSHDLSVIPKYATSVACVNRTLHYHNSGEITTDLLTHAYGGFNTMALVNHNCNCEVSHD